jgi:hypothetical protein
VETYDRASDAHDLGATECDLIIEILVVFDVGSEPNTITCHPCAKPDLLDGATRRVTLAPWSSSSSRWHCAAKGHDVVSARSTLAVARRKLTPRRGDRS